MKKLFLVTTVSFLSIALFAQTNGGEVVKFTELKYDFGKIKQSVPATYNFIFTNVSGKPIVIESASASCGCTTPKWPQAAVMAGKKDTINVGYNAASPGTFSKTITVKVAGSETPVILTINGEVLTPEAYDTYVKEKSKNGKSGK